jgi:hypothetical protein
MAEWKVKGRGKSWDRLGESMNMKWHVKGVIRIDLERLRTLVVIRFKGKGANYNI